MSKTKYIHVGMPKNLSTTLQRDLFDLHPQIMHLGIGVGSNVGYINAAVSAACEQHFQYSRRFAYRKRKEDIKRAFDEQFLKFGNDPAKKACGISLELLSFSFTPDQIEIEEKVERVREVFDEGTRIVIIIREQFRLIESLYKEAIRIGYYGHFSDFLEYIYIKRDSNFIFDFQYDYLVELYGSFFGRENVIVIPIETVREAEGRLMEQGGKNVLFDKMAAALRVDYFAGEIGHYNKPVSDKALPVMRALNQQNVHGIGNQAYSFGTNFHRTKDYLQSERGIYLPDEVLYRDARIKNDHIQRAEQMVAEQPDAYPALAFVYPPEILDFLKSLYGESNQRLQQLLPFELPAVYRNGHG